MQTHSKSNARVTSTMRNDRARGGFTLMEVLVVIIIVTILASVVTINVVRQPGQARVEATRLQLRQLKAAIQLYQTEQGRVPNQAQGLEALVEKTTIAPVPEAFPQEGYLDSRTVPADAWKNPFVYLSPGRKGERFEILSYGSDGEPGGESDAEDLSSSAL